MPFVKHPIPFEANSILRRRDGSLVAFLGEAEGGARVVDGEDNILVVPAEELVEAVLTPRDLAIAHLRHTRAGPTLTLKRTKGGHIAEALVGPAKVKEQGAEGKSVEEAVGFAAIRFGLVEVTNGE